MTRLRALLGKAGSGFAGKSLAALVIKFGAAGLSFAMFVALARAMPQDSFGAFGFAFSLATILCVIGSVGQRNLVLRFASVHLQEGASAPARGVIRRGYMLVGMGSLVLALGLVLVAYVVPQLAERRAVLVAAAGLTVMMALAEFQPNPQRAAGSVWVALLPRDIVLRAAMVGVAGAVVYGGMGPLGAPAAIWIMAALMGVLVLVQAFLRPETHPVALLRGPVDMTDRAQWRQAQWGIWGNSVVDSAGRNLAMVLMSTALPAATVGAVFAALRTSMVLELFLIAVNIVAAPLLASRLHRGAMDEVQRICTMISLMLGLPTLLCFLLFVFFGDRVLEIFGEGYAQAHPELVIMSVGYLVSALAGPTLQLMEMAGYERQYFMIIVVTTALSLLAITPATALFGSLGAAVCIAFNLVALNVAAYLFILIRIGVSPGIFGLLRVLRSSGG